MSTRDPNRSSCWDASPFPASVLLKSLRSGPFGVEGAPLEALLAGLRGERVTKPVLFVGSGTCGLGAGADKTLARAQTYCVERNLDVEFRRVGCIGLCSEEPVLDVQLPGRTRVSFGNVTADKVDALLDQVLAGRAPSGAALGQFPAAGLQEWDEI